jgi:ribosomal protein S18 acetylase RimI-like enzyme
MRHARLNLSGVYPFSMAPSIRSATEFDISAILRLWAEADAEPTHTDNPESLRRLVDHDPGALIVAERNERLVGSVIAAWDGWRASVYRLVVVPSERRKGLARRLLTAAEVKLTMEGAVRLQTFVVETDAQATAFWRASGWEEQFDRLRFVKG